MDGSLPDAFVVVGGLVVLGWLLFELWIRTALPVEAEITGREERGGSNGSSYRARVLIPSDHGNDEKWVRMSGNQYRSLEESSVISIHTRHAGRWAFVRSARIRGLGWLLGFLAAYVIFTLISMMFVL